MSEFPYVEVAAKQGEEFARKKLWRIRAWRWGWMLVQTGMIVWSLYRLYIDIFLRSELRFWNLVLLAMWTLIICMEMKSYREERNRIQEDRRWFSLAPAVVQRILLTRDETKRKKRLNAARREAQKRRDRWAPPGSV